MIRRLLGLVAVGLAVAMVVLAVWVRLAPSDPTRWHVDPSTAPDPGPTGARRTVTYEAPPDAVLTAFAQVADRAPRTARLAGSIEEGRITWIARSRIFGFPDYVTASARPAGDGSVLELLSRLRFGQADLGVNAARLDRWLSATDLDRQGG